jgi:hypothetical protein
MRISSIWSLSHKPIQPKEIFGVLHDSLEGPGRAEIHQETELGPFP